MLRLQALSNSPLRHFWALLPAIKGALICPLLAFIRLCLMHSSTAPSHSLHQSREMSDTPFINAVLCCEIYLVECYRPDTGDNQRETCRPDILEYPGPEERAQSSGFRQHSKGTYINFPLVGKLPALFVFILPIRIKIKETTKA